MRLSPTRVGLFAFTMASIAGCGEEQPAEGQLPQRADDKLIEEAGRPEEQTRSPTLQSGTGGAIPGYEPTEEPETSDE